MHGSVIMYATQVSFSTDREHRLSLRCSRHRVAQPMTRCGISAIPLQAHFTIFFVGSKSHGENTPGRVVAVVKKVRSPECRGTQVVGKWT